MKIHKRSTPETRQRQIFNWPLLVITLLVIAIAVPVIILVHSLQMGNVANSILAKADEAKSKEEWAKAANYVERYLLLKPIDGKRKIDLAELYDKSAKSIPEIQRLITLQSIAIGACEADKSLESQAPVIRRRMIERLMEIGRQEDAMDQIAKVATPQVDLELERWLALCRYQLAFEKRTHRLSTASQSQLPDWLASIESMHVVDLLLKTIIDSPGNMEISMALAQACLGDPDILRNSQIAGDSPQDLRARALVIADRMLAAHREDPMAWLSHYKISSQLDRIAAESDIRQALSLAPEDTRVLKEAGNHYLNRARNAVGVAERQQREPWLAQSEEYFRKVRDKTGTRDPELIVGLGDVLAEQGKIDEAIAVWQDGTRVAVPPTASLHFRIVDNFIREKKLEDALVALQSMDESIRREGPQLPRNFQSTISRVAKQQWSSYYVAMGDYRAATTTLEQVVSGNRELDASNQAEVYNFLGSAYFQMGQWDRAATAFEQAVALQPTVAQYHRGAASAWYAAQRFNEALKQLQAIDPKSGSDWIQVGEVILDLQRRQRPEPGLWTQFDTAMIAARRMVDGDVLLSDKPWVLDLIGMDAVLLRADPRVRSTLYQTSSERLLELCEQYPKADDLWRRSVSRMRAWGQAEMAGKLMEQLRQRAPDSTEATLAQAEVLAQEGMADDARRVLETRLALDPENDALKQAIVQLSAARGQWGVAMDEMSRMTGKSLLKTRELCELALQAPVVSNQNDLQDEALVRTKLKEWNDNVLKYENELRELEGDTGTEWRFIRAKRLLASTSLDKGTDMSEVVEIGGYLDRQRPSWTSTHVLLGNIAERQDNANRAIREYTRAIQLGEQDIQIYERLAELLYRQGMITEASALIDRLGDRSNRSRRLSSLALGLSSNSQQEMMTVAKSGTVSRPRDPMAWVWFGQVVEVSSRGTPEAERKLQLEEAQKAFDKANELAGDKDVRVLTAEFNYYQITDQQDKIEETIKRIRDADAIDLSLRWVTLAQIYQNLGRMDDALSSYEEASRAGANQVDIGNRIAQLFLAQGKQTEAIEQLEKVLNANPNDSTTRRSLATLLASRGSDQDWEKVNKLLAGSRETNTPDDRRLQAELLAQRGTPSDLGQAQFLLEGLVEDPTNRTDEDRFRLASVYVRNAKLLNLQEADSAPARQLLEAAARQLKAASQGSQAPPEYIYAYGDFLLEQNKYAEALEQSERLLLAAPDSFASALLKARLQKSDDKGEQAKKTILTWLEARRSSLPANYEPAQLAQLLAQAGQALTTLKADVEAERLLREAFDLDSRAGLDYVRNLARSEDSVARRKAIEFLVNRVKQDRSTDTAKLLAGLLSVGQIDPEIFEQGEAVLLEIESANESDAELLLAIADLWLSQNKAVQAIDTYRRIIKIRPNDVVGLNNLANLLAEQTGGTEEAIQHIDQAIRIAGRQPLLLDTKGVILMIGNRVEEAIPIFEIAAASSPDPRLTFHLYIALSRAGREQEAARIRAKIKVEELRKTLLTPDDQLELAKFEAATL